MNVINFLIQFAKESWIFQGTILIILAHLFGRIMRIDDDEKPREGVQKRYDDCIKEGRQNTPEET